MPSHWKNKHAAAGMLLLLPLALPLYLAAQDQFKDIQPKGDAHKIVLDPATRPKIELAYAAVIDIEDLADPDTYRDETLDAKRAARQARVAAGTKSAKSLVGDIEMVALVKDTCRAMNSVADFKDCLRTETMWINRVRIQLGKPAIKDE